MALPITCWMQALSPCAPTSQRSSQYVLIPQLSKNLCNLIGLSPSACAHLCSPYLLLYRILLLPWPWLCKATLPTASPCWSSQPCSEEWNRLLATSYSFVTKVTINFPLLLPEFFGFFFCLLLVLRCSPWEIRFPAYFILRRECFHLSSPEFGV